MGKDNSQKSGTNSNVLVKVETDSIGIKLSSKAAIDLGGLVDATLAGEVLPNVGKMNNVEVSALNAYNGVKTNSPTFVPSVHEVRCMDSLGGSEGSARCQTAMKDQFVALVGDSYYSSSVSECDLIVLQQLCKSAFAVCCNLDRALYVSKYHDKINAVTGKIITKVCGFDWHDIIANRKLYMDARNQLANLINDKFYLRHDKSIDKMIYLASRVFADDTNRKTTYIVFTFEEYTSINASGECDATGYFNAGGVGTHKEFTLAKLTQYIANLERFAIGAWYNNVAPLLFHLYGNSDAGLVKITTFEDVSKLILVYNENLLEILRNADYFGVPRVKSYWTTGTIPAAYALKIREDKNGYIRQGYAQNSSNYHAIGLLFEAIAAHYNANSQSDPSALFGFVYPAKENDRYFNASDYPVSSDDVVGLMDFKFDLVDARYEDDNTAASSTTILERILRWSGTVLLMYRESYVITDGDFMPSHYLPSYVLLGEFDSHLGYSVMNGYIAEVYATDDPDKSMAAEYTWAEFNVSSSHHVQVILWNGGAAGIGDITEVVAPVPHDYDNEFIIPYRVLRNYWFAALYDAFYLEPSTSRSRK